jgi:hypothetical protein
MTLLPKGYRATRALVLDEGTIDLERRLLPLSIASEYPVRRRSWDGEEYFEVLECTPEAVDLSRLNGGAPLLLEHGRVEGGLAEAHIGIMEGARVDSDHVVRGVARVGTDEPAEKAWHRVAVDKTLRNVSCTYEVLRAEVLGLRLSVRSRRSV